MQETTEKIVNVPQLDTFSYFQNIVDYFISHFPDFLIGFKSFIGILIGLSIPISLMLFIGIVISVERLKSLRKKEEVVYDAKADMGYGDKSIENTNLNNKSETEITKGNPEMAKKWDTVLNLVESKNPSDWRQAVLDADIMLGELLTHMGYRGEGIGEQLRRVEKGDFNTIRDAGEAHGVRNMIAHSGSDFDFSQHEARKTIHLYKKVFEEFYYI